MSERSVFNTILQAELARWHEETVALNCMLAHGADDDALVEQMNRLIGLLPDDLRPSNVPPTAFVQKPKKQSLDDLL